VQFPETNANICALSRQDRLPWAFCAAVQGTNLQFCLWLLRVLRRPEAA